MYPWKENLVARQRHFTRWIDNKCEYIIIHHTGNLGLQWNLTVLTWTYPDGKPYNTPNPVSAHALIDTNWDAYKLADPKMVTWHAGPSAWWHVVGLNYHGIGIEVLGPDDNGWFTLAQKKALRSLVGHLMAVFKIPPEKVLRHADLTHKLSTRWILWDGISPSRKVDIAPNIWQGQYKSFDEWRRSIIPKEL